MIININTTTKSEDAADFIASSILEKLRNSKRVLFFVTGGSSIDVGVKVAELLRRHWYNNLTIMLTDERYGPIYHVDSNWHQLLEKGFSLSWANLIPILIDSDRDKTTLKFNKILNKEFTKAEYKIGLFGIGKDGHTAGILPDSDAVLSKDLAYSYDTSTFSRITITPRVIEKLDEAVVWTQGQDKWKVIHDLEKENNDVVKQPAQILKKVPLLTIFTDYQK